MIARSLRRLTAACSVLAIAAASLAQSIGEELDTPFVITPTNVVIAMLDLAKVRAGDRLIDLGSGDGRIVLAAAQRGALGLGIEIDATLVEKSRASARRLKLDDRATFITQDLFEADYSAADVVTLYLLPDVNKRLAPKFLATLKAGTRIVSHDYDLGAWPPDAEIVVDAPDKPVNVDKKSRLYFWVVPARVAGRWQGSGGTSGVSLDIAQDYQRVGGTLRVDAREYRFSEVKIDGSSFVLRIDDSPRSIRVELQAEGATLRGSMRKGDAAEVVLALTRR